LAPLPELNNWTGDGADQQIRIRLDDARVGTLRIVEGACSPPAECASRDCGCFDYDSYWVEVSNERGIVVRMHVWAAYGGIRIAPIDLVDGPGDELLVFRIPGRASPPLGYDLRIWKIGATKPVEIGALERVSRRFGSTPIGCAGWKTRLLIDPEAPKPRPITLQTDIAVERGCEIFEETDLLTILRKDRVLRFERASAWYVGARF
jgi:hypothetical protein